MNKQSIEKDYLNRKLDSVLLKLRDAKRMSEMKNACFNDMYDEFSVKDNVSGISRDITKFILERTKLYRDSWITGPIQEIIEEVEKLKKMT